MAKEIKCAYCQGTGKMPSDARVPCYVCEGKGFVLVEEKAKKCPECGGTGKAQESKLPCLSCKGKGVVNQ